MMFSINYKYLYFFYFMWLQYTPLNYYDFLGQDLVTTSGVGTLSGDCNGRIQLTCKSIHYDYSFDTQWPNTLNGVVVHFAKL